MMEILGPITVVNPGLPVFYFDYSYVKINIHIIYMLAFVKKVSIFGGMHVVNSYGIMSHC